MAEHDLVSGHVLEHALERVLGGAGLVEVIAIDAGEVGALDDGLAVLQRDVEVSLGIEVEEVRVGGDEELVDVLSRSRGARGAPAGGGRWSARGGGPRALRCRSARAPESMA